MNHSELLKYWMKFVSWKDVEETSSEKGPQHNTAVTLFQVSSR